MYEQIREDVIFVMLYAIAMTMALMASAYLLFRRGNAFAEDIIPPLRLRRWAAVFFGIMAAGHLWYLPGIMMAEGDAATLWILIGGLLDYLLTLPVVLIVMLCMLQDRRRPLWPVWLAMVPPVIMMGVNIANCSDALLPWIQGYFLLAVIGFTVYMVREVQRYGRWLRDNYADLEHKEVWQSLLVLAVIMLLFCYYVVGNVSITYEFIIQLCDIPLVAYLLWRVETLQDLNLPISSENIVVADATPIDDSDAMDTMIATEETEEADASLSVRNNIGPLLRQHCEEPQLYLQYDLTLTQLAQALGTNRTYLSMYFSRQGTTYNSYINDLRIRHFECLYRDAVTAGRDVTAQELATQSGYRSYRTFSLAFKQRKGQSVTAWMNEEGA